MAAVKGGKDMKRPTIFQGVIAAVVLSLEALIVIYILGVIVAPWAATKLLISILTLSYGFYLLRKSGSLAGKLTLGIFLLGFQALALLLQASVAELAILGILQIWFTRSVLSYRSLVCAFCDLALTAAAVWASAAIGALGGGLIAKIWVFFLCQALFVLIPSKIAARQEIWHVAAPIDRFSRANLAAEEALRRIATRTPPDCRSSDSSNIQLA
ncbi:MAG: hypothetical protein DCC75_10065 [Proteobacteria bacterium]|nr:MAG: hypothetical protein DCC75_10065 [Pseudomonadota bacterium]